MFAFNENRNVFTGATFLFSENRNVFTGATFLFSENRNRGVCVQREQECVFS